MFDIDEVIVPRVKASWRGMMADVTKRSGKPVSWIFRNTYFFDDDPSLGTDEDLRLENIPEYLHMLRHIYRSAQNTEENHKSFMDPEKVLTLRSHEPIRCFQNCTSYTVEPTVGQLHHYRADCVPRLRSVCQEEYKDKTVRDTSLWAVKETVMRRVEDTLNKLGYRI